MFAFLKALVFGAILAFGISLFIGSGGSSAGVLNVKSYTIEGISFYWSWVLFVAGTALSFGILLLMD